MSKEKKFDCIEMKDDIQSRLLAEWAGRSDQEIRERIQRNMVESDSPLAQLWRSIAGASVKTGTERAAQA